MGKFKSVFLLFFVLLIKFKKVFCYYENQAKILTNDGNLVIESAVDKNITFRMVGNGYLNIGNLNMMKLISNDSSFINAAGSTDPALTKKVNKIVSILAGRNNGILVRLARLENGTNSGDMSGNSRVRIAALTRRVIVLENKFGKLLTTLKENNCRTNPCQNGGSCIDLYDNYICQCPKNWEGVTCGLDVNECAQFAGTELGCQNGAKCINTPGSYQCQCINGYQGIHCTQKSNDCATGGNELCGHGVCINTNDAVGYKCICDQGWKTNGVTPACTVDIDECSELKPHCSKDPEVNCINLPGSFICSSCPSGFSGNGYYCVDINECEVNNGGCSISPSVTCINTRGSYQCGPCPSGYEGDGKICTIKGRLCSRPGTCHPVARCIDLPGGTVSCLCPFGYYGSGFGSNGCTRIIANGPCARNPCKNGGTCTELNRSNYTCSCRPGFKPPNCDYISPCASQPCQNGGRCVSTGVSYFCVCPSNSTGTYCQNTASACGGILDSPSGTLKYPLNDAQTYSSNHKCAWLIRTNATQVLNITFNSFNLEPSTECRHDWLQFHDGKSSASHIIGRFCGNALPNGGQITSTTHNVYFWFRSDATINHDGFELSWESIDPMCGGDMAIISHGIISSPGSPGKYPPNRDCIWHLTAPPGKRIQLHFYTMKLESHQNCSYDYLEIHSGSNIQAPHLVKFCNTSHPEPLTSPMNEVVLHFHSDEDGNDAGFQISYAVVEGIPGCGGVFTNPSGEITPPINFDNKEYRHNLVCEYLIKLPPKTKVQIKFKQFQLEKSEGCKFDYLDIYDGKTTEAPLIGKYCGNNKPSDFISQSNQVLIKFRSDHSTSSGGFQFVYSLICGGTFTAESGVIMSPNYPEPYDPSRICMYIIQAPPSKAVILDFIDFAIEGNTYPKCEYDNLEVFDGFQNSNQSSLGRFCGDVKPPRMLSTLNFMYLEFNSDPSIGGRGFKANYSFFDVNCGGIIKEPNQVVRPPMEADGSSYASGSECRWLIVAPVGYVIQLTWTSFDLEQSINCNYDFVQVFDNSTKTDNEVGRFCGSKKPPSITSNGNMIMIYFKSDSSTAKEGFGLTYTFTDAEKSCGGNIFTKTGILRTPGWPNEYLPSKICEWVISVPLGNQIKLNVKKFNLEKHANCRFDNLEIRNGGLATSPLIGIFCGDDNFNNTISFSNKMYFKFVSDQSRNYEGFEIEWDGTTTGCGGVLTTPKGSITSPNYPEAYGDNAQCVWRISVSQGSTVHLTFTDIDFEEHALCKFDYIEIFDGQDAAAKKLGKYCKAENDALILDTSSNHAFLRMRTDTTNQGRGFSLKYNTVCNRTITGHEGVIESPNFPSPYPASANCEWTIKTSKGNKIFIEFSHFNVENTKAKLADGSHICQFDYVKVVQKINDVNDKEDTYCNGPPSAITTISNEVTIKFKTDNSGSELGFRLEWQIVGCGGKLTHREGEFTSPNYPNPYDSETDCEWIIEATPGQTIQLTIEDFNMEVSRDCRYDGLIVTNGANYTEQITHLCQSQNKPVRVTSSGHRMYVKFYSDRSNHYRGFKASYTFVSSECGGMFNTRTGFIYSPNYPQNYGKNQTCEWHLLTDPSHRLTVQFEDFNLEPSGNCSKDSLKVYDGSEALDEKLLMSQCGTTTPNKTIVSSKNGLLFVFNSDDDLELKGFKANFSMMCGENVIVSDSGIIDLRDALKINSENCTWVIKSAQPTQHVTLTLTHMSILEVDGQCMANLTVHDGDSYDAPVRLSTCGSKVPAPIVSNGNSLTVHLSSDAFYLHNLMGIQLFAHYSVLDNSCGGRLTSLSGEFATPNHPRSYPLNAECIWEITASPGNNLELFINSIDIFESENCNLDYLEVREKDAGGKLLGIFCGNKPPNNITASESFWIKFRSSDQGTGLGFIATYSYMQVNEIIGKTHGKISSPLYPNVYARSTLHSWRIYVELGYVISLKFKLFEIDGGSNSKPKCDGEVKIFDGFDNTAESILSNACGMRNPDLVQSTGNIAFVQFDHLLAIEPSRFFLEWEQVPKTSTPVQQNDPDGLFCGGENSLVLGMNQTTFNITSPGFPFGYSVNMNCSWIIKSAIPTYHPLLKFYSIDLEESTDCYSDYIQVYTSKDLFKWDPMAKMCKLDTILNEYHGTPYLKLVFRSDFMTNRTGFTSIVRLSCGGNLDGPNGVISMNMSNRTIIRFDKSICMWNITVRPGKTIKFEFDAIDLRQSAPQVCGKNFIEFRDGVDETSPFLGEGKYCGTTIPSVPQTYGNRAFIRYQLDQFQLTSSFQLRYQEVGVNCGGSTILTDDFNETTISSPKFPNIPTPYSECVWTVLAPAGQTLKITFDRLFELTLTADCTSEYVELRDGGTSGSKIIGRFCGYRPVDQISESNVLRLKYFTDIASPKNGFKAIISITKCGGIVRGQAGVIQSKNYPISGGYPSNTVCNYTISVTTFSVLNIQFTDLHLPGIMPNCSSDNIKLYSKYQGYDNESLIGTYCGTNALAETIYSPAPEIRVVFTAFSPNTAYRGFKLTFNSTVERCGQEIKAESGYITSPGYPKSFIYMKRFCEWRITVPIGRRIRVDILDLDMIRDGAAYKQRLGFYYGHTPYNRIRFVTGASPNETIYSTSNKMLINLWTSETSNHRGFKLYFSSDEPTLCEGDFNANQGLIVAPKNQSGFECEYVRTEPFYQEKPNIGTLALEFSNVQAGRLMAHCLLLQRGISVIWRGGMTDSERLIKRFCGNDTKDETIRLPYADVSIVAKQGFMGNTDYRISYKVHNCGGIIGQDEDSTNVIVNPDLPSNYGKIDCALVMKYDPGAKISMETKIFDLKDDCDKEYILIYNGQTSASPLLGKYCRDQRLSEKIISQRNFLFLEYHSDNYNKSSIFRLQFEAEYSACGGIIDHLNEKIVLPTDKGQYRNNIECIWTIRTDPGYHIGVVFEGRYFIEDSSNCSKDYLELFDYINNEWKSLGRVCGRNIPAPFNSTGETMKMKFRSDGSNAGDGFTLRWEKNCGGVYTVDETPKYLSSPYYPNNYKPLMKCNYTLVAPPDQYIRINFLDFVLEDTIFSLCKYDNLTIYRKNYLDNFDIIGSYCGKRSPGSIREKNWISLKFQTDKWIDRKGFKFEYYLDKCGGSITQSTRISTPTIESVDPFMQIHRLNCVWNITAPEGKKIVIRFERLELEHSDGCYFDKVDIYRTHNTTYQNRLASICGNLTGYPPSITIDDQKGVIMLESDELANSKSFMSAYVLMVDKCEITIDLDTTNSYNLDTTSRDNKKVQDCQYIFKSSAGNNVIISFSKFHLGTERNVTNVSDCGGNYLEVRDGSGPFGELIAKYCGHELPLDTSTFGSSMFLKFVTDSSLSGTGFTALVRKVPSPCGQTSYLINSTNTLVTLKSPNYGLLNYPPNTKCVWTIETNVSNSLHIYFEELNLQNYSENDKKCLDKLEIVDYSQKAVVYEGLGEDIVYRGNSSASVQSSFYHGTRQPNAPHIYCGTSKPSEYISFSTKMIVKFESNEVNQFKGFKLKITDEKSCTRTYTRNQGRIYLYNSEIDNECQMTVNVAQGYTIALYISTIYIFDTCERGKVKIYDESLDGKLLGTFCGYQTPTPLFSTTNKVIIKVIPVEGAKIHVNLDINYVANNVSQGCGGDIFNYGGLISSPLYPENNRTNIDCIWNINVPNNMVVALRFKVFDMGSKSTCSSDFVQIKESTVGSKDLEVKRQYCGEDEPAIFKGQTSVLQLRYKKTVNFAGTGWLLQFMAIYPNAEISTW